MCKAEVKLLSLTTVTASHLPSSFVVFPVLDFSDPFSTEVKPRILLMGLRRSGKSSIQKVVFHKMSPNETLFLESTNKICREDVSNSSFVNFQIWDFPGQIDFFDPTFDYEMIFRGTGALIFVIDAQVRHHLGVWWDCNAPPPLNWHKFLCDCLGLGFRIRNRHFCQTSISQLWLSGFGKGEKSLPSHNPEQQAVFGNCVLSASLKRTSQREGTTVIANESSCVSPLWYSWQVSLKDHRFSATKIHDYLHFKVFTISCEDKFSECEHFSSESNYCSSY